MASEPFENSRKVNLSGGLVPSASAGMYIYIYTHAPVAASSIMSLRKFSCFECQF